MPVVESFESFDAQKRKTSLSLITAQVSYLKMQYYHAKYVDNNTHTKLSQNVVLHHDIMLLPLRQSLTPNPASNSALRNKNDIPPTDTPFPRHLHKNDSMAGKDLCQLLNHLKSGEGSDKRNREFNVDMTLVISTLRYAFEFLHADDLAKLAGKMYPNGKVQLVMDMAVCKGNQWQVGHIG